MVLIETGSLAVGEMRIPNKILLVCKFLLVGMFAELIQCAVAITAQAQPTATPTPTPVSITSPAAGSTVSGVVTFTCTNPSGSAYLYIDDVFVGYSSYSWTTTKFANGSHYLLCNGYGSGSLIGTAQEYVTVSNGAATPTPVPATPTPTPVPATPTPVAPTPTPVATPKSGSIINSPPQRTADFIATLGANAHISQGSSNYYRESDDLADMQYLGIINMRDSYNSYWESIYTFLGNAGIKFDFLMATGGTWTTSTLQSAISGINSFAATAPGSVYALECPNEINNWPITYNGIGGLQGGVNFQKDLYSMAHSDSSLPGAVVYYFTGYDYGIISGGPGPNPATTSNLADYDNQHPYLRSGVPINTFSRSVTFDNENPANGPGVYAEAGIKETISENETESWILDILFDDAAQGIARSYIYELQDEGDGYGVFDTSNNPKPVATGIHNLTTILSDNGAGARTFTPSLPSFSLSNIPNPIFVLELQKSNGAADIIIWNEPKTFPGSSVNVTVTFNKTYNTVNVYDPVEDTSPIQSLSSVSAATISVTDHPIVVEIGPN